MPSSRPQRHGTTGQNSSPANPKPPAAPNSGEMPTNRDIVQSINDRAAEQQKSTEALLKQLQAFNERVMAVEKENLSLKAANADLTHRINNLETEFYSQQQMQHRNFITINGLPKSAAIDIKASISKAASIVGVVLHEKNIMNIRSIPSRNHSSPSTIGIAEIDDNKTKQQLFKNMKLHGPLMLSQLLPESKETDRRIYINDYLCKHAKLIYDQMRTLKGKYNFKFLWCRDGKILARQTENTPVIHIKNNADIYSFEQLLHSTPE